MRHSAPRAKAPPGTALVAIWLPSGSSIAALLPAGAKMAVRARERAVRAGADADGAGAADGGGGLPGAPLGA